MPQYRRSRAPGATFFFTVCTYRRTPLLTTPRVRAALRQMIGEVRQRHPFIIHAWVLLPEHMHSIWELPAGDMAFSKRWGLIKAGVSRLCWDGEYRHAINRSRARRRETTFWQRRFWEHQIRDDADFARHMDYIHWNPVKHGYVNQAGEWPFSTFHRYVRAGVYPPEWGVAETLLDDGHDYGE